MPPKVFTSGVVECKVGDEGQSSYELRYLYVNDGRDVQWYMHETWAYVIRCGIKPEVVITPINEDRIPFNIKLRARYSK